MEFSYHKEQWNHNNCRKIGPTKKETCAQRPEGSKGIRHAGTWGPAFQIEGWGSLKETFVHNILVTGESQRVRPEKSDKKWEDHMTCSPTTDLEFHFKWGEKSSESVNKETGSELLEGSLPDTLQRQWTWAEIGWPAGGEPTQESRGSAGGSLEHGEWSERHSAQIQDIS